MKWAPSPDQVKSLASGYNRIIETTNEHRSVAAPDARARLEEMIQTKLAEALAASLMELGCPADQLVEWTTVVLANAANQRKRVKQLHEAET